MRNSNDKPGLILVLLLVTLFQFVLQSLPSNAAEPDIWNIPAPTIVFQMEKAPRCKGCPSFVFTIYSDKTYHWEGREAVFFLGEGGDYRRWEAYRLADPARNVGLVLRLRCGGIT